MRQQTVHGKERTFGTLQLDDVNDWWVLDVEPHVAMYARRLFERVRRRGDSIGIENTPAACRDLEWFLQRFPLVVSPEGALRDGARRHRERAVRLDQILDPNNAPKRFEFAAGLAPRDYQARAATLLHEAKELLLGDDVGLGKTVVSIAALLEPETRPAAIVVKPHLARQWVAEFNKFAPELNVHEIRKGKPYPIARDVFGRRPEVFVISYYKLKGWQDYLAGRINTVVFDEVQEVRHTKTDKYDAAKTIADGATYRLGLSATPIYNYGGEIWNIYNVLAPDRLGDREEFSREWLDWGSKVREPKALGSWLRENHLFLRRTRSEVNRELEPLSKITYAIDADQKALDDVQATAGELARIIVSQAEKKGRWQASGEFENILRQATGIAKAPYVAAFVDMLVESGEKVLLYGWHRAVYEVWKSKLAKHRPVLYTGTESPNEKDASKEAFLDGRSKVLVMSLRSGAGVDGLQHACRTVVFGELDWSPGVIEQCVGRVHRDGQPDPVTAYFLVSEEGADPVMSRVLGLKREQVEGVRDPTGEPDLERLDGAKDLRALAETFLKRRRR